jgi:integrase
MKPLYLVGSCLQLINQGERSTSAVPQYEEVSMATISVLKSGHIRVQFRKKDLKLISRTFNSMPEAQTYINRLDSEVHKIAEAEKAPFPVDKLALYQTLHPDLKQAVITLPMFSPLLGDINGAEMNVTQLVDKYILQYLKKDKYTIHRLKWWSDHFGHIPVNNFTEDHVRQGIQKLLAIGTANKRGSAPQTTNRFKANLSSVFEFGKESYHLKHNPCRQVRSKPEGKGRKRYLSHEEQQRFLAAAKQSSWDKFYLLILMAITTGARRGELISKLRFCDIDWENSKAFCGDTKNGEDKTLMLTPTVLNELKRFRKIGNELIFCNPRKPTIGYDFRKEWDAALLQAEIPVIDEKGEKLVFHSLRHTFCSTLANKGNELHEIATLAGHKNIQTTMRYTHTDRNRLTTVVNNTFSELG